MFSTRLFAPTLLGFSALTLLSGCAGVSPVAPLSPKSLAVQGAVHGGQQPVAGASIGLYSVGITGDGSGVNLLGQTSTGSDGSFSLTGKYDCSSADNGVNSLVYVLSFGGNPGSGSNANLVMMAALGPCSSLTPDTFINIDEVTTVGSIAALYSPYMTSALNLGSALGDAAFATAFGKVAEYTNTATGTAPGPNLPDGMYASSTEINTLANIIASCVNSSGGVASDTSTACGNLFNLTRSNLGVAPTDTIGALINILNNPNQNASSLFDLSHSITPFQPSLTAAPTTWALPILPIAVAPTFSATSGTGSSAQFVALSDTSTGAVIHYTTDGSTPTSTSQTYSGTITVSSTETLNAIAMGGGFATSAVASATYTITGSIPTYSVSGQFNLTTGCGGGFIPPITVTLTQGTTVVQTVTSLTSGNFTFTNVPNDTYTITPSITGPASLFYPATQSVTVSGNNLNLSSIGAALGYTVSGTVAYSGGTQTGQTYLALIPVFTCGGGGTEGTSILTSGAFTIQGVPPGSYTLQAFMDNVGNGTANASNPSGSISTVVSTANLTGQNVTLADPTAVTIATAPTIKGASGFNTGAVVQYNAITNSSGVETAASYTIQWSASPTFATTIFSQTFRANGTKASVWFLHGLTDTSIYYFRAFGSSAGTIAGPFSNTYGPVTIGAPTGANAVSGAVSFSATPGGPLYVGFLGQTTGNFYAQYIASPASAQAYTIQVPSDSYNFFAILDQNHDGLIDTGDIQDATENGNGPGATTVISGNTSSLNLTLPTASANAILTTQFNNSISPGNNFQAYYLNFQVNGLVKQPVAVTLTSGPNLINPVDIAICGGPGSGCNRGFQIYFGIGATVPIAGDTYAFNVTYSDGSTGILTATITAVLNALPTNLAPQTGTSTSLTPTFTWTDPINASNYTYQFSLCCSNINNIWQVPGQNSNGSGFPSTITSITWGIDPTGGGSSPSIGSLVNGTNYSWSIQVQDSNGNSAQTQVQYQP